MSLKSANKTETNTYSVEITIDGESFEKAIVKAYNTSKGKFNIPGFRRGKAPRSFIERMYGEDVFYDEALNILFPDEYEAAVEAAGLEPVADPFELDIPTVGKDGATITFKVTVKPEAEVGTYKGLAAEKGKAEVTDEELDAEINRMRERNSRMITVDDRAVESGDTANIDFEGFVDGTAFEGGKGEGYDLVIGSGTFIPGFEEQITGHVTGDEFDVNVTFPEEYADELKGKAAVFKVKLNKIEKKELPELDDEFAKDVSEYDTLAELKEHTKQELLEHKQEHIDSDFEQAILDQVIEGTKVEIPGAMIEKAIDNMISDFDYRIRMQGADINTYLSYIGMDMKALRDSYKERAEKQVKLTLALEKIAVLEKLEILAEDVEAEFKKYAEAYQMDVEAIKKAINEKDLKVELMRSKAVELIKSLAVEGKAKKAPAKKKAAEKAEDAPADEKPAKKAPAKKKAAEKTEEPAAEKKPAAKKPAAKKAPAKKADDAE
ncbi:MAG: trigger factor [Clostridiales bacterium]|nr:trigger factor [Clostridiales bacterium]